MPWAELIADDFTLVAEKDVGGFIEPENDLAFLLCSIPALIDLPDMCASALSIIARRQEKIATKLETKDKIRISLESLADAFRKSSRTAIEINTRLERLDSQVRLMFESMAFNFLFDRERQFLSVGYRITDESLDPSSYDLLASEARLASFIAIAKGDVPTRHWFRLGRSLTPVGHGAALTSWSGSMFEYLMPSLVLREPRDSLLEQTSRMIVGLQIEYGTNLGVPWGISESAYNVRDLEHTYQYSSFGIPDLGFKRGLGENIVIAPYATALASMVDPGAAALNFAHLTKVGGRGTYGWYEALDYTAARLPKGTDVAIVCSYMAHHQGMSIIAISEALHDGATGIRTRCAYVHLRRSYLAAIRGGSLYQCDK
jgi:cyclic beta-1,2-glucan synthetase